MCSCSRQNGVGRTGLNASSSVCPSALIVLRAAATPSAAAFATCCGNSGRAVKRQRKGSEKAVKRQRKDSGSLMNDSERRERREVLKQPRAFRDGQHMARRWVGGMCCRVSSPALPPARLVHSTSAQLLPSTSVCLLPPPHPLPFPSPAPLRLCERVWGRPHLRVKDAVQDPPPVRLLLKQVLPQLDRLRTARQTHCLSRCGSAHAVKGTVLVNTVV